MPENRVSAIAFRVRGSGKLPSVGNTVDIPNAIWTNTIGAPELITVWTEPDFDPSPRAFYYARVIEIPTPRWIAYDAKYFHVQMPAEVPMVAQQRAYISPIWYSPKRGGRGVMIARLCRQPLLHFLLAGEVLFAVFGRTYTGAGTDDHQIVVTAADAAAFARTWNRPPEEAELRAQIQDYIREEVLYRTALSLGLEKDDTIVRRRLRQKMEFLLEDTVPPATEAELRAYYQQHPEKFRSLVLISFRQIFVSARRGGSADADARNQLGPHQRQRLTR